MTDTPTAPQEADLLIGQGIHCLEAGRYPEAAALFRRTRALRGAAEDCYHLGLALHWLEQRQEAMAAYRQAISLRPDFPEALGNLGILLKEMHRLGEAAAVLRRALTIRPDHVEALSNLGLDLQAEDRAAEAAAVFRKALALRPGSAELLYNLARAQEDRRSYDEAAAAARRAAALRPDYAEAWSLLGTVLGNQEKLPHALAAYRVALTLRPDLPKVLCNLAKILQEKGALEQAIRVYGRSLHSQPDLPEAHWNLSLALLLKGELERGWEEYEWRWRRPSFQKAGPRFTQPQWRGEFGQGRTLLIHAEQGFGDSIQFIRYVGAILLHGWRVVVELPRPLLRLFSTIPGIALVAAGDPLPPFDAHCPMLSLPLAFGTGPGTIPAPIPYLAAEPERAALWRDRLPPRPPGGIRVGVVWQGNPQGTVDRGRSYPLASLAPLARLPGVRLVSLQKTHGLDQLGRLPPGMEVASPGPGFDEGPDAFLDTAAAMAGLDLIVSSDTSVAHLAGALGRPVWVALKAVPDWRWQLTGERSPWYPTMRLFRQGLQGDWEDVFRRMAAELARLLPG
ncbi:tetratricopeptide repeat protein [Azospirillum thermophilum]|nr:tetratricopeptide repeat protein [Azospirillum thermophilum]